RGEDRADVAAVACDENSHLLQRSHCTVAIQRDYRPGRGNRFFMPIDWDRVPDGNVVGAEMLAIMRELFPIPRSLTGDGVRRTLAVLQRELPLEVVETPSGTEIFDWVVPREWNLGEAWIEDATGKRVLDLAESPLHVLGYSSPVDAVVSLQELRRHVLTHDDPDLVPYRTS